MTGQDKMPSVQPRIGGRGVQVQVSNKRPHVHVHASGMGVQLTAKNNDLLGWFASLQKRLERVYVLNRNWDSGLSPTVLGDVISKRDKSIGIFMDPPYLTTARSKLYHSDVDEDDPDRAAVESYEWSVKNGERYKIAYACHEGDFDVPDGWTAETMSFRGIRSKRKQTAQQDMVMFSPLCESSNSGSDMFKGPD